MEWFSKDTFTAGAAAVAAVTGLFTFIGNMRRDRILVRYDTVKHEHVGHKVLVQNLSPFEVHLYEVGFIRQDGELLSLTELQEDEDRIQADLGVVFCCGKESVAPREKTSYFFEEDTSIVGGYAITTAQKFYRVDIGNWKLGFLKRLKIRLKLAWQCL